MTDMMTTGKKALSKSAIKIATLSFKSSCKPFAFLSFSSSVLSLLISTSYSSVSLTDSMHAKISAVTKYVFPLNVRTMQNLLAYSQKHS